MIIVEGPDGAGKSTLVHELQELFPGLLLGERGVADRDNLWKVTRQDTYRAICKALTDSNPRIWDRLFWSEFAYWQITSRDCQFDSKDEVAIPQIIAAIGAPVIWCLPPLDIVQANVTEAKQMSGVAENIQTIYNKYLWMLSAERLMPQGLNILRYDYTASSASDDRHRIVGRIESYLLERRPAL